ncbi:MAG: hypothetical protein ACREQ9_16850 [Candidatus Binatia bacterium]
MKARDVSLAMALAVAVPGFASAQVASSCSDTAAIETACGGPVDHVVCINDFQYTPNVLQVTAGQRVAWVNVEACGDTEPEDLVVNTLGVGCNPTHQVVTAPEVPGVTGDTVNEVGICSPHPGVAGASGPATPPCGVGESNVRCATLGTAGIQHYTCFTNPGHLALMHGAIIVE